MVHPDKCKHPQASAAFEGVLTAWQQEARAVVSSGASGTERSLSNVCAATARLHWHWQLHQHQYCRLRVCFVVTHALHKSNDKEALTAAGSLLRGLGFAC
jgi:hypothetical protein